MKLRVCFIIPTLDQGGAEKQLSLLVRGLDRSVFEPMVIVLTRTGPREQEILDSGIPVHHIGKRMKLDPMAWWRLRTLLKKLNPDIVHSWIFAANAYGRTAAMSAKVPIILGSERSVDPWKNDLEFWIDKYIAKRTQGITANSQGTIDFYSEHGIERSYFHLIPNGIEPVRNSKLTREQAFESMGVSPDKRIIVSVGRLWPQKGYKDLIWAADMLRVLREDLAYVIIGEGPERQRLEEYRDNIGGTGNIHLIGERNDVSDLLPHCDMLWNGSLYEGQSNVILEAMQSGVVVVASDIPGNREVIDNDRTGILYPLGKVDHLCRMTQLILNDRELSKLLASNAKLDVQQKYSVQNLVTRHAELYRSKAAGK